MNFRIAFTCILRESDGIKIRRLAHKQNMSPSYYIEQVLLRHLETLPEIDLSQSLYSQPKGVSNGK